MRVIFDPIRDGLATINTASRQLQTAQQQVASGRRMAGVGDDPRATQQAILERSTMASVDAYTQTRDSAAARLSTADAVLSGFGDKLTAAIVAGLSARGTGVAPAARAAAAEQVRGLRESLVSDINTTFNGTYLFSGTRIDQAAYAQVAGAWTYQGDAATVQVEVERDRLVSVSFNGQAIVRGSDSIDTFSALDDLAAAIEAGDNAAIGVALDAVQRGFDRSQRAIGGLGADERGLDEATPRLAAERAAADIRRSQLEDANLAEAVTQLTVAENAYRAALSAVSTAERQSLLDYLR
jgi:flagellar hook-associated protein 3 FlgL